MGYLESVGLAQRRAPPMRPQRLSFEVASNEVQIALRDCGCDTARADFLRQQWKSFTARMQELDQIWVFESYSCGASHRRGLALERNGFVVTVLLFPYW